MSELCANCHVTDLSCNRNTAQLNVCCISAKLLAIRDVHRHFEGLWPKSLGVGQLLPGKWCAVIVTEYRFADH